MAGAPTEPEEGSTVAPAGGSVVVGAVVVTDAVGPVEGSTQQPDCTVVVVARVVVVGWLHSVPPLVLFAAAVTVTGTPPGSFGQENVTVVAVSPAPGLGALNVAFGSGKLNVLETPLMVTVIGLSLKLKSVNDAVIEVQPICALPMVFADAAVAVITIDANAATSPNASIPA
ncbi:MAG: hypothetical protein ACHQNA_07475 [Acidimicrobiales bacterium]